ncbi:Cyclin-like protein [Naviculisporaceae sp. PSN 640]
MAAAATPFVEDLNNIVICKDCKEFPPNLIEEFSSGDLVCGSCGVIVGDRIIDTRSEWRTFSNDDQGNDDPSRVGDGPNELYGNDNLQTSVGSEGKNSRHLQSLQNKQNNNANNTKFLTAAYRDIQAHCETISAGSAVANAAKHIFKLVDDHKAMKGKSQEAIIAGCIFIACRQANVPRTFLEIYRLTKVSKKEIGRVFKQLESFLQKVSEREEAGKVATVSMTQYTAKASTSAVDLCERFCNKLSFDNSVRVEGLAKRLAQASTTVSNEDGRSLSGRSPLSVAAACIYMAANILNEARQSKDISKVVGVSDGTVKTAYKYLYQAKEAILEKSPGVFSPEEIAAMENLPGNAN